MTLYLGIDAGSVATKLVLLSDNAEVVASAYVHVHGKPVAALQQGLKQIANHVPQHATVRAVGATGSGRQLAAAVVGADVIKNEITSQAVAALHYAPEAQTVIEIGGQDSKIIILRNGMVTDFGMNTVCAAGTGSFLEQQAQRLNVNVEDFGQRAVHSRNPVRIVGRCAVFAQSDMIQKQQAGYPTEDILYGLCQALVRNYMGNVALGKEILPPVVFQGGVALNRGIVRALEEALGVDVMVPPRCELMGATGAALLAQEESEEAEAKETEFNGFQASEAVYRTVCFECRACPAGCEVSQLYRDDQIVACWGGRCDLWEGQPDRQPGMAQARPTAPRGSGSN